ncbi:hypothetical protein A374_18129 [Fictibacillus macauensis ZFHKF-1]|uniref:Uncharacterized protein n=1 Tax=Fictibacillus macauensis ZFHKF-1 TaxID=1196324 RepID=I8AF63_9BACL|nr:hypothetical protein [Fictibacillus macauensis]EIT83979.1 hypothetical protein A374_18129 [Fictibacillus macauensis ZFHKF-1]
MLKKTSVLALSGLLLTGSLLPSLTHAASSTITTKAKEQAELNKVIKQEKVSKHALDTYKKQAQAAMKTKKIHAAWKVTAVRKAVKFVVTHRNLIPIKAVRNAVEKYGGKMVKAVDTIEVYSWWGLTHAFMKVGIPEKVADMLADFIVKFFL